MLKNILRTGVVMVATSFLFVNLASASTVFSFASWADNGSDPNYQGETGGRMLSGTVDGITVDAYGFQTSNPSKYYYAYLDQGHAGMGVCKRTSATNKCLPSSDDNVTADETLRLVFDQDVIIESISFRDVNHGILDSGSYDFNVDGNATFAALFNNPARAMGKAFDFAYNNAQFYINTITVSAVPLPPAILLFGAALGGIGFMGRRRKAKMATA